MNWIYENEYNILNDIKNRIEDYKIKNGIYPTNALIDFQLTREFEKQSSHLVSDNGEIKNILGLKVERYLRSYNMNMIPDDIIIGSKQEIKNVYKQLLKRELNEHKNYVKNEILKIKQIQNRLKEID